MSKTHDEIMQQPPLWDPVCGAVREENKEEHICNRWPHEHRDPHNCPCGFIWMGDPAGPDFIRL